MIRLPHKAANAMRSVPLTGGFSHALQLGSRRWGSGLGY